MSLTKDFEHLRIGLEAIKSATNNFGDSECIGRGGFGKVYKGELLLSQGRTIVAVKRLDGRLGQGAPEFWKEIMLLTRYRHENVVSLLGFCDESGESILVYEYLSNKSLDLYLSSNDLTWKQRLHICIGAARGLHYLHDPGNTEHRVLHRDIKSSNILLDGNWNARISDFGLSKIGPANQQYTYLVSNAVGTMGYIDPIYMETGLLTKESDIYSFGVVLCGRLSFQNYNDIRRFLPSLAQKCYTEKKLETIIHDDLREQISPNCLEKFSTIAYLCLRRDRKERPSVAKIVEELENAIEYQVEYEFEKEKKKTCHVVLESNSDEYWEAKLPPDWEIIIKRLNLSHDLRSTKKDLFSLLREGVLFDDQNRIFSLDDDGKKCELISSRRFLDPISKSYDWIFRRDLRFSRVADFSDMEELNAPCHIGTSMLSLGVMYAASLVFQTRSIPNQSFDSSKRATIKWKYEESIVSSTHYAEPTKDGWLKIIMWYFFNQDKNVNFDIVLDSISYPDYPEKSYILIQGIEFLPIEMMDHCEDVDWESKMQCDYEDIIQRSDKHLEYTTKKELYFLLCAGVLIDNGQMWFSLCKSTGGKCHMLPATQLLLNSYRLQKHETLSQSESRFTKVVELKDCNEYDFIIDIEQDMFSPQKVYLCYLVFKFPDDDIEVADRFSAKVTCYLNGEFEGIIFACLLPINIPIIKPKSDNRMPKDFTAVYNQMQRRNDDWMEVIMSKPLHNLEAGKVMVLRMKKREMSFGRIRVEGIEFRPM